MKPTAETVRSLLLCDAATGRLFWKARPVSMFTDDSYHSKETRCAQWNSRYAGREAGSICRTGKLSGYKRVSIFWQPYLAHHIVWLLVHGEWPDQLDHRRGIQAGDGIDNLRIATPSQNTQNSKLRSDNKSGFKGVHWMPRLKKWRAMLYLDGKRFHLGLFVSKVEAAAAYRKAAEERFGEFARFE